MRERERDDGSWSSSGEWMRLELVGMAAISSSG